MGARRRRGTGKKNFPCGHVGKGIECNRCGFATKLEGMAVAGAKPFETNKKKAKGHKKARVWSNGEMLAEAKRLKEDGRKF